MHKRAWDLQKPSLTRNRKHRWAAGWPATPHGPHP